MIEGLVEYYANLLIVEYRDKPKAFETIKAIITQAVIDCLPIEVRDGFNIDTAVGDQLDIVGKYFGKSRTFNGTVFDKDFYGFATYAVPAPTQNGFSTYTSEKISSGQYGYITFYEGAQSSFSLTDPDYRTLLHLIGIGNNSNHSGFQIDTRLFNIFGGTIIPYDGQDMTMVYIFPTESSALLEIVRTNDCLPKPMGVGIIIVIATDDIDNVYGYKKYSNPNLPNEGFSTYADGSKGEWFSILNI